MPSALDFAIVSALTLSPALARADCDIGSGPVGYGFIVPERDCAYSINADASYGFVVAGSEPETRVGVELGVLRRSGKERWGLAMGPALGLSVGGVSYEWEGEMRDWQLAPRWRFRWWAHDWLTLDLALGPSLTFTQESDAQWYTRPGFGLGISPRIHGAFGLFAMVEHHAGRRDDPAGQWQFVTGVDITAALGALGAIIGVGAYACAEVGC